MEGWNAHERLIGLNMLQHIYTELLDLGYYGDYAPHEFRTMIVDKGLAYLKAKKEAYESTKSDR